MTDYLSLRISAVSARCKFGAMIQDWYCCNGWRPWTLASWAESAGFHAIPYGKMGDIFNGVAGELSRQHFESLAEANRRLFAQDYGTFANNRTAHVVRNAVPLLHQSGAPWTASDFWACYCGLLAPTRPLTRHD
jgi:hypothetical protein